MGVLSMEASSSSATVKDDDGAILPEDVIFNILSLLPVICILRFKSVCKSWYSLIQTSALINHHRELSKKNNDLNLIIAGNHPYPSRSPSLNLLLIPTILSPPIQLELDSPCLTEFIDKKIDMLVCNGIVCLHVGNLGRCGTHINVSLWNPATRQLLDLPQSPFPSPDLRTFTSSVGFGFDVKTNDYKFVRIFTNYRLPSENNRVELYSLNSDSWRTLDRGVLPDLKDVLMLHPKTPFRENTYCWLGTRDIFVDQSKIADYFILTFNFTEEIFGIISLPEGAAEVGSLPHLAIVEENIAFLKSADMSFFDTYSDEYVEVWMLCEYGGLSESWTKLYKVGPFRNSQQLGISENGDFLFFRRGKGTAEIYIYNVVTQEITYYPTQGIFGPQDIHLKLIDYKESLIFIERGDAAAHNLDNVVHSVEDMRATSCTASPFLTEDGFTFCFVFRQP